MHQNIEIAVRIKPSNIASFSPLSLWDAHSIQITDRNQFTFDAVIHPNATQDSVFDKVGMRVISNILQGYNGCIFAYGQTGSGKTFTMTGDHTNQGLVQKCLKKLWNCVKNSEFFQIKLGYFQIYNQTIKDLLSNQENLSIREHAKTGFYVENLTEVLLETYDQFEHLLNYGIAARTVKQTKLNSTSSRSHSVLQVNLTYKKKEGALTVLKHAKLTFIDLAGSQKQKQTQVEGQRLKQAANINKSLSSLSLVISKLSQQSERKSGSVQMPVHIPFRNSVLTKILKNSLTGKSKIIIVCTVSLQERFIDQTISTLRFAQMAKSIKMKVNKNEQQFDGTKERLFEQFAQVKQKYFQLDEANKQTKNQNEELKRQNACLKDQLEKKEAEITELQVSLECMKLESRQALQEIISHTQMPYQISAMSQLGQINRPQNQVSQSFNNYRKTQIQQSQMIRTNLPYQNSQSNNHSFFYQPQTSHNLPQLNQYSQASIFTSQISPTQSKKNSFFTITQEDSKTENSGSESKEKIQTDIETKILALQTQLEKFKVENEFMKFYRQLQEHQIAQLIKKNVFLAAKEEEIEQANNSFVQLVKNQEFSHAQMKFLETCLKNCQKDKLALKLSEEQKANQKLRFNQTVEKIKKLLMSYTENQFSFNEYPINHDVNNQKSEERFMTPKKGETNVEGSILVQNPQLIQSSQNNFHELDKEMQIEQQRIWDESVQKRGHKSEKKRLTQGILPQENESKTPTNSRQKISQTAVFGHTTQILNQVPYQSASQFPMFMQDNRSILSQTSNRLSNNELQYLKKDYQRMSNEAKEMKDEIDKFKILLLEKDSQIEDKTMELDEVLARLKIIEQDLETEKQLLQIERHNNKRQESKRREGKVLQREEQVLYLRQYIAQLQKKHESSCSSLRLRNKELELAVDRLTQERDSLMSKYSEDIDGQRLKMQSIAKELAQIKTEKEQLEIQYGVVNSENVLLTERYNYLKSCIKTNNKTARPPSPQRIYSKNSSFFSLSQPYQKSQNLLGHHDTNPHCIPNTQADPHLTKPKQLTQNQCIQAIENNNLQYMYQAAYYFYKKSCNLEDLKRTFEQKLIQIHQETNLLTQKHRQQIHQLDHNLVDAKRSALAHEQAVVDLKKQNLELKQQVFQKDKLVDEMCSEQKRTTQYFQLLQIKLKEKNQKQLEAKQKAHNLSAQLRDNSLTPIYSQKNIRLNWGRKSFNNDSSEDSLVSNGDTPIHLGTFISSKNRRISVGERSSIEKVRNSDMDDVQVLRREIEQVSNEKTSVSKLGQIQDFYKQKEASGTQSLVFHTVTNEKMSQQQSKEDNLNQLNFVRSSHNYQGMFGKNQKKDRVKAASTKGHLPFDLSNNSTKVEYLFKSKK